MDFSAPDRLPTALRSEFDALLAIEEKLLSGIAAAQSDALNALAGEREEHLRRLCDALETLSDTALRHDTLLVLAGANQRIADAAAAALHETMVLSQQGAHQRKAISAYGAMDEDAG